MILCLDTEEEDGIDLDRIGQLVNDLVMWKDVSKSTFLFGSGSMGLLSSCFTQGLNFRYSNFSSIPLLFFFCLYFYSNLRRSFIT